MGSTTGWCLTIGARYAVIYSIPSQRSTKDMMTLTQQSQDFALDLHAILRDFDPTHWKTVQEDAFRERLAEIEAKMASLVSAFEASTEAKSEALESYILSLKEAFHTHRPTQPNVAQTWERFRQQAIPIYEEMAQLLKNAGADIPSFRHTRPTNYIRNVFHVAIALGCVLLVQFMPQQTSLGFWLITIIAGSFALTGWSLEISRRYSKRINDLCMVLFRRVAHPHETHHINSSTWYTSALFLISLSQSPLLCTISLGILGVSDPMAAIIGKRFGRTRFKNGRSLEGTLAFIISGTLASVGLVSIFHPTLPLTSSLMLCLVAAVAGGLVELWIERVDDNLAIPIASVLASAMLAWILKIPF